MKTRKKIYALLAALWVIASVAQNETYDPISTSRPQVLPTTPSAAALIQKVTYPVNYSAGLVDVNIPIHEIKIGEITLPITLSYHGGGFRPDNTGKSWVGAGWSLNAEPQVSRSIAGKDDFDTYGYYGWGYSESQVNHLFLTAWVQGQRDGQPDQFYYTLPGKSGSFFFSYLGGNDVRKVLTHPYQPLDIRLNTYEGSRFGREFHITDENGVQYHFGRTLSRNKVYAEKSATSSSLTEAPSNWKVVTWKGTEIISPTRADTMYFSYDAVSLSTPIDKANDNLLVEDCSSIIGPYDGAKTYPKFTNFINNKTYINSLDITNGNITTLELTGTDNPKPEIHPVIEQQLLRRINYRGGYAEFQRDAYNNLEYISLYDAASGLIKKIRFYYADYSDVRPHSCYLLDSLDILGSDLAVAERYRFGYYGHNDKTFGGSVRGWDHWGFFLGNLPTGSAISAVPNAKIDLYNRIYGYAEYLCKRTDFSVGKATTNDALSTSIPTGTLKYIVYPTGGRTRYNYKPNYYGSLSYPGNRVGGFHIDEIQEYDPVSGRTLVKRLEYGSACMLHRPNTYDYMYEQTFDYVNGNTRETITTVRARTYLAKPKSNLMYPGGAPLMYEDVSEYRMYVNGNDTVDAGRTDYHYNFYDGTHADPIMNDSTTIVMDTRTDWRRGQLLSKKAYKRVGTAYQIVSSEEYTYQEMNTDSILAGQVFQKYVRIGLKDADLAGSLIQNGDVIRKDHHIVTGCKVPESVTTRQYFGNDAVVSTKKYQYYQPQPGKIVTFDPIKITTSTSEGINLVDERIYTLNKEDGPDRQELMKHHRLSTLLETWQKRGTYYTGPRQTLYYGKFNIDNDTLLLPRKTIEYAPDLGRSETRIEFLKYDSYGNPVYLVEDGYKKVVYLWGYNSRYPLAEITNASYEEVSAKLTESAQKAIAANVLPPAYDITLFNNLRTMLPEASVVTFTHKPGVGILTRTEPDGRVLYYDYDPAGRLSGIWFKDASGKKNIVESYQYHYSK